MPGDRITEALSDADDTYDPIQCIQPLSVHSVVLEPRITEALSDSDDPIQCIQPLSVPSVVPEPRITEALSDTDDPIQCIQPFVSALSDSRAPNH